MSALVFDSSPLSHFARAGEIETLDEITRQHDRFVTQAVLDEVERGVPLHPRLAVIAQVTWLRSVRVDGLDELAAFAAYSRVLGAGERNVGESSTLAWAEIHTAIAIVDERAGTRRGRARNVEVHGTLWLVAHGFRCGLLTDRRVENLIDALSDTEAWFPCQGSEFMGWARSEGLF